LLADSEILTLIAHMAVVTICSIPCNYLQRRIPVRNL